jgi:hypothetical protein
MDADKLKMYVGDYENPGIFSQKAKKVFIIGYGDLLAGDKVAVIVVIAIKNRNTEGNREGYGQQEPGMFSQDFHRFPLIVSAGSVNEILGRGLGSLWREAWACSALRRGCGDGIFQIRKLPPRTQRLTNGNALILQSQ